jgi:hypothetical protein
MAVSTTVGTVIAFLQAGFPVEFTLLFVLAAIVDALISFGVLIGVKKERREREKGGQDNEL